MDESVLKELGLENVEIKVYLSLLQIGASTTGALVKKSGVPSSRIYTVLENLTEKELVSYTILKNTKYYKAHNPSQLRDLIKLKKKQLLDKEEKLDKILPELQQYFKSGQKVEESKEQKVQTFEGMAGIKTALENVLDILQKGDTFIVFGAPKIGNERLNAFFNEFHKKRARKGIKYKVIYNLDAKEFGEQRKKYPLTQVKYLSKELTTPSVFWIFGDYIALVVFSESPVAMVIKNKQIKESFMAYFNLIWSISKTR